MTRSINISRAVLGCTVVVFAFVGLVDNPVAAFGLSSLAALFAVLGTYAYYERDGGEAPPRWTTARHAGMSVAAVLALAGLISILGLVAVPVAALMVGLLGWQRWRASGDGSGPTDRGLARLSDAQLIRAWQASHSRLGTARTGAELGRIHALRRQQLDELERRDPAAFRRWIGGGGWAAADADPFLGGS